jgi:hypothetical protein
MAPSAITLAVQTRGEQLPHLPPTPHIFANEFLDCVGKPIRKLPKEVQIAPDAPTKDLYDSLAKVSGYSIHRLRITKATDRTVVPNSNENTIAGAGLGEKAVVHVKDLGMFSL